MPLRSLLTMASSDDSTIAASLSVGSGGRIVIASVAVISESDRHSSPFSVSRTPQQTEYWSPHQNNVAADKGVAAATRAGQCSEPTTIRTSSTVGSRAHHQHIRLNAHRVEPRIEQLLGPFLMLGSQAMNARKRSPVSTHASGFAISTSSQKPRIRSADFRQRRVAASTTAGSGGKPR